MKRALLAVLAVLISILGATVFSSSVSAAGLNDFVIQNYQIDFYLDRDKDGRSTLRTDEVITAVFPQTNQNHGLERAIPTEYDGRSTRLSVNSVTDQNNREYNYTTYESNNNTVLRIGDADKYVHGATTYKISYTQHDVTKFFQNTNADEFYWDANGTEWKVPIQTLTTRLHVSKGLRASLTGKTACYQGFFGSSNTCTLAQAGDTFATSATNLVPFQGVTIAVGFKPQTFNPYKPSSLEVFLGIILTVSLLTILPAMLLILWFIIRYRRRSNRTAEIGTVVPEYLPPPDTSVTTAAAISRKPSRSFSAQLVDYAVRHYTRIYETRPKSFFRSAKYELEIVKDITDLKHEEQELLTDMFVQTNVGAKLDMSSMKNNYSLASRLQDNPEQLKKLISTAYGLRKRDDGQSRWFKKAGFITLGLAAITFSPFLLAAAITSFVCGAILKPLADKGLDLARYLKGLEMFIKVAEQDRLNMLQSPEGAAKVDASIDANTDIKDPRQLIKLYERVLPYAILFGQEKEWNKRLGQYYQDANTSPDWYHGNNTVFNAAVFSSAMSSFTSSATYSNPSSSSSGGSGGGGSSGGGGGGGGGGGW